MNPSFAYDMAWDGYDYSVYYGFVGLDIPSGRDYSKIIAYGAVQDTAPLDIWRLLGRNWPIGVTAMTALFRLQRIVRNAAGVRTRQVDGSMRSQRNLFWPEYG